MKKIIKNKASLTLNPQKNERTLSSYPKAKNQITNSAYSLRTTNIINPINTNKYQRQINTNKYLICNTSPNNKITKNLNLTRTIQNITRSSRSKEGILSNKLVHKNNVLSNINPNSNISNISHVNRINSNSNNINTNRHTVSVSYNTSVNTHQKNNLPLTDNAQRNKYQRISIKTNNINNNTSNYNYRINSNINNNNSNDNHLNNISSPTNKNYCYANLNKVRISHKAYGIIQAYATITSSGKRNYNEDRVSIIYNIPKPPGYIENKNNNISWPNCSFFGLYDGHGGSAACDFLRDNLHKYIINDKCFPSNPQKAIANGFIYAEKIFFKNYTGLDSSGSCAIVVLIIENRVYIANVGDSRAILSAKNGTKFYPLSRDHRPGDEKEYKRILDAGGKIYKTEYEYGNNNINNNTNNNRNDNTNNNNSNKTTSNYNYNNRQSYVNNRQNNIVVNNYIKSPQANNNRITSNYINSRYSNNQNNANRVISPTSNINPNRISSYTTTPVNTNKTTTINIKNSSVVGPLRVSPGKLSVSRTIGDITAKDPRYGGNPNVIISIPEIKYFDNSDKNDFILIFCDGIYEKLKNKDIIDCLWKEISKKKFPDIHNMVGYSIEKLVGKCLEQNSTDNLTVILICLKTYEKMKLYEAPVPQTENIEQVKTKKLNITANLRQKSQSKKPLSMLLTKMIHNNSQNIKKVINLKNTNTKDNKNIKDNKETKDNKDTKDIKERYRRRNNNQ